MRVGHEISGRAHGAEQVPQDGRVAGGRLDDRGDRLRQTAIGRASVTPASCDEWGTSPTAADDGARTRSGAGTRTRSGAGGHPPLSIIMPCVAVVGLGPGHRPWSLGSGRRRRRSPASSSQIRAEIRSALLQLPAPGPFGAGATQPKDHQPRPRQESRGSGATVRWGARRSTTSRGDPASRSSRVPGLASPRRRRARPLPRVRGSLPRCRHPSGSG